MNIRVHQTHCCVIHGCKYGDNDNCPVVNKTVRQTDVCQDCDDDDIAEIPESFYDPSKVADDGDLILKTELGLREEVKRLREAIRDHRDATGHDRCQLNNEQLYSNLPEALPFNPELPPLQEFLPKCIQYWIDEQKQ